MLKKTRILFLIIFLLILNSCIGISADIVMRKDGSGKISLEYRFSRMAEVLGRLDGNENWHIIPTGRADIERTVARIPDMRLVSFSSRDGDKEIVNKAELEFKNTEALLAFLDPSGRRASLSRGNGSNSLTVIIMEPPSVAMNADLLDLVQQVSSGYELKLSFSANGNSAMTLSDGIGKTAEPPRGAKIVSSGKKVSLEMGTGDILGLKQGLGVSFNW